MPGCAQQPAALAGKLAAQGGFQAVEVAPGLAQNHRLQLADLALGLAGVLLAQVAVDVVQLLLDVLLLGLVLAAQPLVALLALGDVVAVIAAVDLHPAEGHLPDGRDHAIHEVAVVADGQHRAVEGLEEALQPFHRVDVQMVGRLVQDEQVGRFQQQAAQQGAGALPAGESGQRALVLVRAEAQASQHHLNAALILKAAGVLVTLLEGAVGFDQGAVIRPADHLVLQPGQARFHLPQGAEDAQHLLVERVIAGQLRALRQEADAQAAGAGDRPGGGRVQPDDQVKQGGLADAVGADQGDARVTRDAGANPGKDVAGPEALGDVRESYQRHGRVLPSIHANRSYSHSGGKGVPGVPRLRAAKQKGCGTRAHSLKSLLRA